MVSSKRLATSSLIWESQKSHFYWNSTLQREYDFQLSQKLAFITEEELKSHSLKILIPFLTRKLDNEKC